MAADLCRFRALFYRQRHRPVASLLRDDCMMAALPWPLRLLRGEQGEHEQVVHSAEDVCGIRLAVQRLDLTVHVGFRVFNIWIPQLVGAGGRSGRPCRIPSRV